MTTLASSCKFTVRLSSSMAVATMAVLVIASTTDADETKPTPLASKLVFHASFDDVCDANLSSGSGWIYTAETLERKTVKQGNRRSDVKIVKKAGRFGDALHFQGNSKQVLMYKFDELSLPKKDWSATFSFWLKLDPNKDLKPGYCDPLQLTQKRWNDAALFVDFDKTLPRDFRLGVFPDFAKWNPSKTPWDKIPADKRPLVTVKKPPFSKDAWTHVVFTLENANSTKNEVGTATLFVNGKSQGSLRQPLHFSWEEDKTALMIGINYIGFFDDLAVFSRALSAEEVMRLHQLPKGIRSIE